MAPALTVTPQYNFDAINETELPLRRRALASVDNLAIPMEEDDMGLQNQPSLAKDSQEMEQILVDLGSSDLVQADLLQAIKTLESGGDTLSTGDPDVIFPLSGFDLADTADSEGDSAEDKIRLLQARLERRCAFLLRRLRILQARSIGKRISEEAAQTFEKSARGARKDGGGRPLGLKALLKRIETTAALQASASSRSVVGPQYYKAGTSKGDATRSASIGIASGTLTGLEDSAGALRSHLSVVKHQLDSDATASSSGAESNDEAVTYNNPIQQQMPIASRALWSWQRSRASVASRWVWLQVQVQELEYKIRQHRDLHKQVREAKGPVEFEGEPVGYEGSLPGDDAPCTCARVRPLRRDTFKKRKLLQMHNLHIATTKAAKPSDVKCSCQYGAESCAVCTGREEATQPAPPARSCLARVDPAHHPVLSDVKDVSPSLHLSALSSRAWFRSRCGKAWRPPAPRAPHAPAAPRAPHAPHAPHSPPAPRSPPARSSRRHHTKLKRGRPPLSRKIKERDRDEDSSTSGQDRRGRGSTEWRSWRRQSYDIDNIVIPQSVAASTRPEILTYKEIVTPKWRVMEIPGAPLNNGVMKFNRMSFDSDDEDISEAAIEARHTRAELRERNRYMRKRRSRRNHTEHDNDHDMSEPYPQPQPQSSSPQQQLSPPPQPQQPSPPPQPLRQLSSPPQPLRQLSSPPQPLRQLSSPPQPLRQLSSPPQPLRQLSSPPQPLRQLSSPPQPLRQQVQPQRQSSPSEHETVRPYSPRQFPLQEDQYMDMLSYMPEGYRPSSPEPTPPRMEDDDELSPISPLSPFMFDGDDPDDAEWNPRSEKSERRRSTLR